MERGRRVGLFFLDDEVGGGDAGVELDPVRDSCRDVENVAWVKHDLFASGNGGSGALTGAGAGLFLLHFAPIDDGERALLNDHLVGPKLVALRGAGVDTNDKQRSGVAEVVQSAYGKTGWRGLRRGDEFGLDLTHVGGGVEGDVGRLGKNGETAKDSQKAGAAGLHQEFTSRGKVRPDGSDHSTAMLACECCFRLLHRCYGYFDMGMGWDGSGALLGEKSTEMVVETSTGLPFSR